jgi:hypothetical protein
MKSFARIFLKTGISNSLTSEQYDTVWIKSSDDEEEQQQEQEWGDTEVKQEVGVIEEDDTVDIDVVM